MSFMEFLIDVFRSSVMRVVGFLILGSIVITGTIVATSYAAIAIAATPSWGVNFGFIPAMIGVVLLEFLLMIWLSVRRLEEEIR